jgi:hypothetical protein
MFGIETREIGVCNFDYFSVDMLDGEYRMGGKTVVLGDFICAAANLPRDFVTELLRLGGELNQTRRDIRIRGGYDRPLFETARSQIHAIVDFVKGTEPFCRFDTRDSLRLVDQAFDRTALDEIDLLYSGTLQKGREETYALVDKVKETVQLATHLLDVYCYLTNDTANFATMIQNFTVFFMHCHSRSKEELAICTNVFCNSEDVRRLMEEANLNKDFDGVNLRPRVSQVPVTLKDRETGKPYLARRLYFGRLMDFFVTEWFEGMMRGHYLWQCGVCGRYFLMTTAHRQLYCKKFNPAYGTTCDHVANNRRLGKEKGLKRQKKKDNPLWIIRNKRYASIRKNKSLGKYSEAVSDEAKQILDEFYQTAESDAEYADRQYLTDIRLENLYRLAQERLK